MRDTITQRLTDAGLDFDNEEEGIVVYDFPLWEVQAALDGLDLELNTESKYQGVLIRVPTGEIS